jgi:hypothetical protein
MLTALLLGMTFANILELPSRMGYSAPLYLSIHRTLHVAFGSPNIGAFVEIGTVISVFALALLVRRRRRTYSRTLAAAIGATVALVVYFVVIEPANVALRSMPIETPPINFSVWRDRLEYGHAARFALYLVSFAILVFSMLSSRISDSDWAEGRSSETITPTRQRTEQWYRSS